MANEPDPPNEWRVYEQDKTPDPEPAPPSAPPSVFPPVPYGDASSSSQPIVIRSSSGGPKLVLIMIAVIVLGVVVAGAVAIFAAVDSGIGGLGGIDAKDPDDFEELIATLEEERGTTVVHDVNFYTDYIIVYMPYTDDPKDDRQIAFTWRGGDLEEWTRGTTTDPRFDLKEIDPDVIEGMCDPVLERADGATPDDCSVFLSPPSFEGDEGWFRASASDDFGRSVTVKYDKEGVEIPEETP
ncbi:hypothetical protein [Nocardioides stalactiti]|uniref:hypothetical protein n=1 Tax=Nocardioides stalactiti TaxID=2755356 RepID=UPI0016001140|nr:hypothetical protein [Nocardioides stalactiti]